MQMMNKYLGIELGSTRIKAVMIDDDNHVIASGGYSWENKLVDGIWTYDVKEIWTGVRAAYKELKRDYQKRTGEILQTVSSIGISAMMHGYMAFDKGGKLLVPFRTWRNTITGRASKELTDLFKYPIPQRWTIAHLYKAILDKEEHVSEIDYLITLEGYIHYMLTGERVIGIGEASGMFPVDIKTKDFDEAMVAQFDDILKKHALPYHLREIFPKVLVAGQEAGRLTKEGAYLLDESGDLNEGIPFCPPEGDAGTGMVATNSVAKRTGNVSVGTSIFAMIVLEKELSRVYEELDLVTTPCGNLTAMVHCNNCSSEINAWMNLFEEILTSLNLSVDKNVLFEALFKKSRQAQVGADDILVYNYLSGEHITGLSEGRPMVVRKPESKLSVANFMKAQLYACFGALKMGMDILLEKENVDLEVLYAHGGLFKTEGVVADILAAASGARVDIMETASEGGAFGMAILASYLRKKESLSLEEYLRQKVFADASILSYQPKVEEMNSFEAFMKHYKASLSVEKEACKTLV